MYFNDGSPPSRARHILASAEFLRTNLEGLTFDQYLEDQALVMATLYALQVAGEAAIATPDKIKNTHPEFPWQDMRRMRNIIVHEYFRVNLLTVWNAVHNHFLPLEQDFRALLDSLPEHEQ